MSRPLRVLCLCTHNRTRSVIAAALLTRHCADVGADVVVRSVGMVSSDEPPTDETVRRLRKHLVDVSAHRSRIIRPVDARAADIILTAEHDHVVELVGRDPELYERTFTLPEFVRRAEAAGARGGHDVTEWLAKIGADRPTSIEYLDAIDDGSIGEVADPTGRTRRHWSATFEELDDLTRRVAVVIG